MPENDRFILVTSFGFRLHEEVKRILRKSNKGKQSFMMINDVYQKYIYISVYPGFWRV